MTPATVLVTLIFILPVNSEDPVCWEPDVDRSGFVDGEDLLLVLGAWARSGDDLGHLDVNCDGAVDTYDMIGIISSFGQWIED